MKSGQRLWTRDELILALNLYFKIPFAKYHKSNPEVIKLSELIDRTPSSVALKLGNLASFDPSLKARGIKGASNASKLDKAIWNEYCQNRNEVSFEGEQLLAKVKGITLEELHQLDGTKLPKKGTERERLIKVRVNQNLFRAGIMSSFNFKCCITGISLPELLVAGHIKPWSLDEENRMNFSNGLSMNALHDKAFEVGLITITPEYLIKVSPRILNECSYPKKTDYFTQYHGKKILLPNRFLPGPEFLDYHNNERFQC